MGIIIRLIVAIVVAAVVVWLLGDVAHLKDVLVGVLAILAFIAVMYAPWDDWRRVP